MPPPAGPGDLPPTQRAIGGPGSWRRWRAPSRRPSFWVFLADPLPGIRDGPGGSILRHRRNPAAPWRAGMGGLKTSWERNVRGLPPGWLWGRLRRTWGPSMGSPGNGWGRSSGSFRGCARPSGIGSGASMRTTGGQGESASLLLGVTVGLPANFGRWRGQIGRAGGGSATAVALDRGGGGREPAWPDRWRHWRRPHWLQPAVSPTRKGGGSAIFGAGGDQPPLATSRRCWLAAVRLCVPPAAPAAEAGGPPAVPGPAGAVLTGYRVR